MLRIEGVNGSLDGGRHTGKDSQKVDLQHKSTLLELSPTSINNIRLPLLLVISPEDWLALINRS